MPLTRTRVLLLLLAAIVGLTLGYVVKTDYLTCNAPKDGPVACSPP